MKPCRYDEENWPGQLSQYSAARQKEIEEAHTKPSMECDVLSRSSSPASLTEFTMAFTGCGDDEVLQALAWGMFPNKLYDSMSKKDVRV